MTLRISAGKRTFVLKAPISVVCFFIFKAMKDKGGVPVGVKERRETVKILRQAKKDFGKLTLAEITSKDGRTVKIRL